MTPTVLDRRVGWLGTGRMGSALARRLLAAGCDVLVYNRTRARAEPLAAHGATVTATAAGLAGADIVFVTVGTSQDLLDAVLGPGGLLDGPSAPAIVVDCSTVSAEASQAGPGAARGAGQRAAGRPGDGKRAGRRGRAAHAGGVRSGRGASGWPGRTWTCSAPAPPTWARERPPGS